MPVPAKSHRSDYIILATLGVIAALVIFALVSSGWLRRAEPEFIPVRTTYSTRPAGTMACYLLFERLGIELRRSDRPLLTETLEKLDVLFLTDPILFIEEGEMAGLRTWVREGGVLVYSGPSFSGSPRERHVHARRDAEAAHENEHHPVVKPASATRVPDDASDLPLARDVATVRFDQPRRLDLRDAGPFDRGDEGERLFADSVGTRIVSHQIGDGRLIVLADSSFLANGRLGKEDNAILAANLAAHALARARGGRVAFDEYHFGYGSRPTGWSLLGTSLLRTAPGWAVLCLMTAGVLFLIYKGRRFGTRYPPTRTRRRSKLEYVHSVGATYRAAGAHGLAFELVYSWFRRKAASAVGLPPTAPVETIAATLARRTLRGPWHYQNVFTKCDEAMAQPRLSARRASALVEQLAAIESEVFDGHRTRK